MRCLPRLRAPAPAGFVLSPIPSGVLRAPAASILPATATTTRLNNTRRPQTRRYLSTTPIRPSQPQPQSQTEAQAQTQQLEPAAEQVEETPEEWYAQEPVEIQTQLVYPEGLTTAVPTSDVTDPSYKPAETADGLEEVGGLDGWWDEPTHWGSEGGPAQFVQSVVNPFGPFDKVTDPAMLEVLAKRAIVEALVVNKFAGPLKRKHWDKLFASAGGAYQVDRFVLVELVANKNGVPKLKDGQDWARLWSAIHSPPEKTKEKEEIRQQREKEKVAEASEAAEAETEVSLPAFWSELTPEVAKSLVAAWSKEWKKAELRDPVIKYYVAKRIQQLTGHRIPDGKLVAISSIDSLLKELVEPEKPLKLAELLETKGVFEELPNVRVFPRRVTPVDKEKMVGRWKVIVKELEKRELPVIGTGDHGPPVEKKWIEGRA